MHIISMQRCGRSACGLVWLHLPRASGHVLLDDADGSGSVVCVHREGCRLFRVLCLLCHMVHNMVGSRQI